MLAEISAKSIELFGILKAVPFSTSPFLLNTDVPKVPLML